MLLQSNSILYANPTRQIGGAQGHDRTLWGRYGDRVNVFTGAFDATAAIPIGHLAESAWLLPEKSGGMSMRPAGSGGITASPIPGLPIGANLTGLGDLDAAAALTSALDAALSGSGTIAATLFGNLNASADLVGSGGVTAALEGLGSMVAALLGTGSIAATIAAYGDMEIDIVVTGTGLSNESIAAAVWDRLASLHPDLTTMGGKLNNAEKLAKIIMGLSA